MGPNLEKVSLKMDLRILRGDDAGLREWALKPMTSVLISDKEEAHRHRPGRDEGRDWRDAPAGHWSPRELEEQGTILSDSLRRDHSPADTLISNFCL